jgi:hypothetical protein
MTDLTCAKDADCPGTGICERGVCKAPSSELATRPAAAGAPAPMVVVAEAAPAPAPPVRTERRRIPALYITGPAALGAAWLITIGITVAVSSKKDVGEATSYAAIPVFGPWVMMASSLNTSAYTGPLVLSGVFQAAALAVTILGITVKRDVSVPASTMQSSLNVTLVPSLGGAAVIGTF